MESSPATPPRRVKLYRLSATSTWEDMGTGFCVYVENENDAQILVRKETDESILLEARVDRNKSYQKQQDTLIVWADNNVDLALSFQEPEGCAEIWDRICDIQEPSAGGAGTGNGDDSGDSPRSFMNGSTALLPNPELANLRDIETMIKEAAGAAFERNKLATFIITDNYIDKLLPILAMCEDIESVEDLHTLCNIMKAIILLNDNTIIEYILNDDIILGVVGILEYDPEFPSLKANHREYLANNSKFKQIIPIKDKAIESKIHQTFRLQYLKDVALPRILDDATFSILNSLIFFNHVDIVNHLQHDTDFLTRLFGILNNPAEKRERKRDVVMFVQQFCSIAKNLQMTSRTGLYRALSHRGLFSIFDHSLTDPDPMVRMAGAEILVSILEHDPNLVRSYIIGQTKRDRDTTKDSLVGTVILRFIEDPDLGLKAQYAEVIRVLLDTTTNFAETANISGPAEPILNPKIDPEAEEFLNLFYDNYMQDFVGPIMMLPEAGWDEDGHAPLLELDREQSAMCQHICEILCFAIKQHAFRSKYFVISTNISLKTSQLFRCREKHMKLAALRVFRTCVGISDEFYNRYLVKNNLVEPIVRTFLETNDRNNLINSVCLELFEHIRKENQKVLVAHIVTQFGELLKDIDYVDTFRQLVRRHEQNIDTTGGTSEDAEPTSSSISKQTGADWASSTMDASEEAYFNDSDEEEEEAEDPSSPPDSERSALSQASPPSLSSGMSRGTPMVDSPRPPGRRQAFASLVDYDDDETGQKSDGPPSPSSPSRSSTTSLESISSKRSRDDDEEDGDDESLVKSRVVPGGIKLVVKGTKSMKIEPQAKKRKPGDS